MKKAVFLLLAVAFISCGKDSNLIEGKVQNENGEPIENVLVQVMSTDLNSRTNADGEFRINTKKRRDDLIFTHPDYEMNRVEMQGRSEFSVELIKKTSPQPQK